ncbi:MAG: FAD-dependent oxidoreductase [Deltaproteobacteria bacterium]|nr:FAD-dependent oxidoreductase [Deltaproteobacteria bacterium]
MQSWKCNVCGYVHQGETPPASCVLCGADQEHFSALTVPVDTAEKVVSNRWRCTICDHIHNGSEPPPRCIVCGAASDLFVALAEEPSPQEASGGSRKILILGGGIAGLTAAEEARKRLADAEITLLCKEACAPYYRLNLTRFLAGEVTEAELPIQTDVWFDQQRINLIKGEALQIDRRQKQVSLRDGRTLSYDRLILTNGSHPFVPPIPGATHDGVFTLRTINDAHRILERLQPGLPCVCIGGGLLGLETAAALARQGAAVTILEGHSWLMPRQLPQTAGELLKAHLEKLGISVLCAATIQELAGDERLRSVLLNDGREIPAALAVISTGVRPNSCLARQAELKVKRGLLVDDRMATSAADIFAAGDITEHNGRLYGIWPASYAQGAVAGINAAGGSAEFTDLSMATRIKVVDVDLFSIGQLNLADASYRLIEKCDGENYCGLVCRDNHLLGAALFGDTSLAGLLKESIEKEIQLAELPEIQKLFPELTG